jgi:light-regulated signal transduction histidine kinase (bacteriophytochrome)
MIHREDREFVTQSVNEALNENVPYSIDHRVVLPDGSERIVHERADITYDENCKPIKMIGTVQDITERKNTESELAKYRKHLEDLVEKRTSELKKVNESLRGEIAERKQTQEKLNKTLGELELSNKELEQFAYVASHDLQEPLRKVRNFTELLAKRYKNHLDGKADKFIDYIVDGVIRMQGLISDLLSYSRLDTQGKELNLTDSTQVFAQVLDNMQIAIDKSGAKITHDPLPTVMADAMQLGQLFQNLIGNSIKFCDNGAIHIHIAAEKKNNECVFSVCDNGIGIEAEYAERIFEIFQRLHSQSDYPGTGIGLAICKKIVERHGGRIWMKSEPEKGATFYFTLHYQ